MKNNKGVTLVELIIVIVIIGIISAFTVPAVGRYLENAQKSAVLEDARQIRNAADNYCAEQGGCIDGTIYEFVDTAGAIDATDALVTALSTTDLLSNFTDAEYVLVSAEKSGTEWLVTLTAIETGSWEWLEADPLNKVVGDVDDAS